MVPDALSRLPGDRPANTRDMSDDRIAQRMRILLPPERWAKLSRLVMTAPSPGALLSPPPLHLFALDTSEPIDTLIDRVYATSEVTKAMLQALT